MVAAAVDIDAIQRQLEYYFSDSNLPRDKFLRAKTEENEDGYVDIAVLLSFNRLQKLSATPDNIAQAAAASTLLAVDPEKARVRRTTPLPEVSLFNTRAVFAKGWAPGSEAPSIDQLADLFSPSGRVLSVRVRRWVGTDGKKHFKGSVFVEMESPEAAERVVAEEYQIDTTDADGNPVRKELLLLPVEEYFEKKKAETRNRARRYRSRGEKRQAPGSAEAKKADETANGGQTAKSEAKMQKQENGGANMKRENGEALVKSEYGEAGPVAAVGDEVKEPAAKRRREQEKEVRELKPGLILKFDGFGPGVTREDIREAFEAQGEIAWVDFHRGNSEGYLRFAREGDARDACTAMTEAKTEFGGKVPTFSVLSGEAEETYWKQMWDKKDQMVENAKRKRREGGRGGHGGRGGRRFRGGGRGRGRR